MKTILDNHAISRYVNSVQGDLTADELWEALVAFLKSCGSSAQTYHHIPPAHSQDNKDIAIFSEGFPRKWVERYIKEDLRSVDPIIIRARYALEPFQWSMVESSDSLGPKQVQFFKDLREAFPGDGFSIPAFGPAGRHGYFGVAFPDPMPELTAVEISGLHWACHTFHVKFCAIRIRENGASFRVSDREREIIKWLSKGQSSSSIAQLIGSSEQSIEMAINKLYKKMNVSSHKDIVQSCTIMGVIDPSAL